MNNDNAEVNQIQVEIIVREGCNFSYQTLKSLLLSRVQYPSMKLSVVDIADCAEGRQSIGGITPSIWVNNKLWFLGSFSSESFHARMSALMSTTQ
ncbi:MAG: hypothetical protein K9M55_11960 [Candidatus Marinimicrobia bacterium]|nr:hypothetical protein [Candidatus Neomarinimicrobiota bacterium]MCF7923405.1 hypothetical protein [Candidatus Neomarinimicrobiota bacterium]